MQKSNVDFYPVLLLSILADTLLRLHTGYWARAGLLALPASAAVLAAVLLLVSTSWQGNALLQKVLCVLLAISSALEILRLHALFGSVYPGTLGLAGTCFVVLAPVIYLRREPALRQTANALLVFGAACMAIMVLCFSAGAPAGISAVCPLASAARPALPQGSNICRVSTGL